MDVTQTFDTSKKLQPGYDPTAVLTLEEAHDLFDKAGCHTNAVHLRMIVKGRLQCACGQGKSALERPFDKLTRPAAHCSKQKVLEELQSEGFVIELDPGGDIDATVIHKPARQST